jgi:hypothetical protein
MLSCVVPKLRRIQPSFCQPTTGEIPDATESDDLQSGFFFHTARKSIHYVMDLPKSQLYHIRAMSSLGDELRNGREQESWEGHSTVYLQGMARLSPQPSISIRNPMFPIISRFMVYRS